MRVNGVVKIFNPELTLADFLQKEGYDINRIAVERNGEIIPKARFQDTLLKEQDTIEVVRFVGGG